MRINGVANTVSFGYNRKLNESVNKYLEATEKDVEAARTLLEMNKFCNTTEDKLRKAERERKDGLVDLYADIFIGTKAAITDLLDSYFPFLDYKKQEIDAYKKEMHSRNIEDEPHWLSEIVDILEDKENLEIEDDTQFRFDNQRTNDTSSVSVRTPASSTKCNYVEKFVPTEFSPKGFESLGGMNEIKEVLFDKLIYPLYYPEMSRLDEIEYGKKASRGEMFYGPPGCGKTSIIEAIAAESGLPMYKLKISKAGSEYVNKSAINVQQAFEYVAGIAEETGEPVLFVMDEMESMTGKRKENGRSKEDDKLVSTLLQIIESARSKNVIILGATNYYNSLDDAIKSRFEDKIYIGLPDDETRQSVLKILLNSRTKGQKLAADDKELEKVVELTKGFSNRDLTILTDKAALLARKDNRRDMRADDYIVPVRENQNMKVHEDYYMDKTSRPSIGFSTLA